MSIVNGELSPKTMSSDSQASARLTWQAAPAWSGLVAASVFVIPVLDGSFKLPNYIGVAKR